MNTSEDENINSYGQFSKPWDELEITDNYLFCKIMSRPDFCKEMIERILGIKVKTLSLMGAEKPFSGTYVSHGIRLDVAAADDENVYDIEFQSVKRSDLQKRMRFYQGTLDIDSLSHGQSYEQLRETWIVFICDFDQFVLGEPGYKVRMSLENLENRLVTETYEDGTHKIFINLEACDKIKDERLRNFLIYLKTNKPQDRFTEKISSAVDYNKRNAEWRKEYMTVAQEIEYEKAWVRKVAREEGLAEGRAEGRAEGHAEGLVEGRTSVCLEFVRQGIISITQAAGQLCISEDEVRKMMEE